MYVLLVREGGGGGGTELNDDGECVECVSGRESRSTGGGDEAIEPPTLSEVISGRVRSGGGIGGPRREVLADAVGADGGGRFQLGSQFVFAEGTLEYLSFVFTTFVMLASLAFSAFCLSSATVTPISTRASQPGKPRGRSQFTMMS